MKLIETILYDKELKNFDLHIKRAKQSAKKLKWNFNKQEWIELKEKFTFKQKPLRVRITYSANGIEDIELFEIKQREFKKFKIVDINFNYNLKYKNRKHFQKLHEKYPEFDEFILIKNGLITDTTISNLAFFTGNEWITPKYPLLKGTKREELLKANKLKEENIKVSDLKYFKKIALLNAILGFYETQAIFTK